MSLLKIKSSLTSFDLKKEILVTETALSTEVQDKKMSHKHIFPKRNSTTGKRGAEATSILGCQSLFISIM